MTRSARGTSDYIGSPVHHPNVEDVRQRELDELRRRPSTTEPGDWVQALARAGVNPTTIVDGHALMGVALQKQADPASASCRITIRARRATIDQRK